MKKRTSTRKLSRTTNERKQLMRNLVRSLILHGKIVTTEAKADFVRPVVEKLITRAKENSLTNYRLLVSRTGDVETAKRLLEFGGVFAKRPGGYTRTIRLHSGDGNNAPFVQIELVEQLAVASVVSAPSVVATEDVVPVKPVVEKKKEEKVTKPIDMSEAKKPIRKMSTKVVAPKARIRKASSNI